MGHYNFLANSNDGFLRSGSTGVYLDARAGNNTAVVEVQNGLTELHAGQFFNAGTGLNFLTETFLEFTHTPVPTSDLCTSACFKLHGLVHTPVGDPWSLEVREKDWGGTVTAADWIPGANLTSDAPNLLAEFPSIRTQRPAPITWRAGNATFRDRVSAAAPLRMVLHSNKLRLAFTPDGNHDEYVSIGSFEGAAGPNRPRIDYSTVTKTTLARVSGAQVQLTDATWAFLDATGVDGTPTVALKHADLTGTITTIATLAFGAERFQYAYTAGAQAFSLARDPANNLYVAGPSGSIAAGLNVQGFAKGTGYTWAARTSLPADLPGYDQAVNSTALTWHGIGAGRLVVVAARAQGYSMANQTVVASLSPAVLLAGAGNPVSAATQVPAEVFAQPINTCGNGVDVMALSAGVGFVAATAADHGFGETEGAQKLYKYQVDANGSFVTTPAVIDRFAAGLPPADGNALLKLVPISTSRCAVVGAGWVSVFSWADGKLTLVGRTDLTQAGVSTLGTSRSQPWDAVYDPSTQRVQVYYLDQANGRRLMRTSVSTTTALPVKDAVEVATNLGASGSTHLAVRVGRGSVDERRIRVALGNRAGDGTTLSTVVVVDSGLNRVPNAPVLTAPGQFTAQTAKLFTWAFSDPNPADRQSAVEATVRRQSDAVTMYSTGKVATSSAAFTLAASTLSNATTYEWRVRVYDSSDTVSDWSAWQPFSTAAAGVVNIIEPVLDGDAPASARVAVTWTFTAPSAVTQVAFRVRAVRTDTNTVVFNSGFINGPAVRTYTVSGLVSDVEQRIEVIVQDSSDTFSSTAERLIVPSFSAPDQPTIQAAPSESETEGPAILVSVTNPTPTGDLPPAGRNDVYRAETGTDLFTKIGECPPNGEFLDYGVAANTPYDYAVHAVADGEAISDPVAGVVTTFLGMSLHLASDPSGTVRAFPYGGTDNSDEVSAKGSELRFVGRTYPVFDFGEQLSESVKVTITAPYGPDYAADVAYLRGVARSRATHCFRDGRGRKVFGVVTAVTTSNAAWGSTAAMTVQRVDYDETRP